MLLVKVLFQFSHLQVFVDIFGMRNAINLVLNNLRDGDLVLLLSCISRRRGFFHDLLPEDIPTWTLKLFPLNPEMSIIRAETAKGRVVLNYSPVPFHRCTREGFLVVRSERFNCTFIATYLRQSQLLKLSDRYPQTNFSLLAEIDKKGLEV